MPAINDLLLSSLSAFAPYSQESPFPVDMVCGEDEWAARYEAVWWLLAGKAATLPCLVSWC